MNIHSKGVMAGTRGELRLVLHLGSNAMYTMAPTCNKPKRSKDAGPTPLYPCFLLALV